MSDNWSARCTDCNAVLTEDFRQPEVPCPHCSSTARVFSVELADTAEALDTLRLRGYRAGETRKKGLFIDSSSGLVAQRGREGAVAHVVRIIDKDRDPPWYTETVTMRDTGEVVHRCSEPLSQHQGHGSDLTSSGQPKRDA
jgi:hypothetical protein